MKTQTTEMKQLSALEKNEIIFEFLIINKNINDIQEVIALNNEVVTLIQSNGKKFFFNPQKKLVSPSFNSYEFVDNDIYLLADTIKNKQVFKQFIRLSDFKVTDDMQYNNFEYSFESFPVQIEDFKKDYLTNLYLLELNNFQEDKKYVKAFFSPSEMKIPEKFYSYTVINPELYLVDKNRFLRPKDLAESHKFKSYEEIEPDLFLLKEYEGKKSFFCPSTMRNSPSMPSPLTYKKINDELYLISIEREKAFLFLRDMNISNFSSFISYEIINENCILLRHEAKEESILFIPSMKKYELSKNEKYEIIGKDLLLTTEERKKKFVYLKDYDKTVEFKSHEKINLNNQTFLLLKHAGNKKSILNLTTGINTRQFESLEMINQDLYWLKGENNCFFKPSSFQEFIYCVSYLELESDLYLLSKENREKYFLVPSIFKGPTIDSNSKRIFETCKKLTKDIYLLEDKNEKAFFSKKIMFISRAYQFERCEVINNQIYCISKFGSRAKLNQLNLEPSEYYFD